MKKLLVAVVTAVVLTACGGHSVYLDEAFKPESPYQRKYSLQAPQVCNAAQLALLSQGYRIEKVEALQIKARKDFQPDDETNVTIDFDVMCKDFEAGSMVFANAVETTYMLKKNTGATSLSIPAAGSFSLPWSKSADSLVKVAGKTIADPQFYARFLDLMASYLKLPPSRSR